MAKTTKKAPVKKTAATKASAKKAPAKASAKKATAGKAVGKKSVPAKKTPVSAKAGATKKLATKPVKAPAKTATAKKKSAASSKMSVDHDEIRQWAEARGGKPATVMGTGGKEDVGLLRLEFPDKPYADDGKLEEITWDEFFEKFDSQELALLYQEQTAGGKQSSFNKLIDRKKAMLPK